MFRLFYFPKIGPSTETDVRLGTWTAVWSH